MPARRTLLLFLGGCLALGACRKKEEPPPPKLELTAERNEVEERNVRALCAGAAQVVKMAGVQDRLTAVAEAAAPTSADNVLLDGLKAMEGPDRLKFVRAIIKKYGLAEDPTCKAGVAAFDRAAPKPEEGVPTPQNAPAGTDRGGTDPSVPSKPGLGPEVAKVARPALKLVLEPAPNPVEEFNLRAVCAAAAQVADMKAVRNTMAVVAELAAPASASTALLEGLTALTPAERRTFLRGAITKYSLWERPDCKKGIGAFGGAAPTGRTAPSVAPSPIRPTSPPPTGGPVVSIAKPTVSGGLAAGVVRKFSQRQLASIAACYRSGLAKKPRLAGKLVVGFSVGAAGAVSAARVEQSSFGDPVLAGCTTKAVSVWRFPHPVGGKSATVSLPVLMRPE